MGRGWKSFETKLEKAEIAVKTLLIDTRTLKVTLVRYQKEK